MNGTVRVYIPRAWVTPEEFSALENVSLSCIYKKIAKGLLPVFRKRQARERIKINYLAYVKKHITPAPGSNESYIICVGDNIPAGEK